MTIKKQLIPGFYAQIYLDSIHGSNGKSKNQVLEEMLDRLTSVGAAGIIFHGFTKTLTPIEFLPLSQLCVQRNILALAAYGLNATDPIGKATRIAQVANMPECYAVVFDMESSWEIHGQDNKGLAKTLGDTFRSLSPDSLVLDQPWPDPTNHYGHFPWEETAAFIDIRAAQWYCNDFTSQYGKDRYSKCWDSFSKSWETLDKRLALKNLVKPEIKTVQSYRWIFADLISCVTSEPTLIFWIENHLPEDFMVALEVVFKLKNLGFTGLDAVKNYQASVGLNPDNDCGEKTVKSLGLEIPKPLNT